MSTPVMTWWAIVLDLQGDFVSVRNCGAVKGQENGTYYVQARRKDVAIKRARRTFEAERTKTKRAQYRAEGRCRCSRVREEAQYALCSICRANQTKVVRDGASRLATLLDVRDMWLKSNSVGEFSRRLSDMLLEELQSRPHIPAQDEQLRLRAQQVRELLERKESA